MTRETLLKLAAKVGLPRYDKMQLSGTPRELQRLVDAAVAEEREACAKLCDELVLEHPGRADLTADQCAAAIRARSKT